MGAMIGSSARPFSVSAYSTRGGTSGKVWRSTIPSSSSARSRSDSVRGLIPVSERSSSQKRDVPAARSRTSRSVHFPHTTSAVRHTGHVPSTAISAFTLPTEVLAAGAGRLGHGDRRLAAGRPACGRLARGVRLGGLAVTLGDSYVLHGGAEAAVSLHEQLEVVLAGGD